MITIATTAVCGGTPAPTGQVLGNMPYWPFGDLVATARPSPMFGFTAEQQNLTNNLVYLRAR